MTGVDERHGPRLEPAWAGAVITVSAAFAYLLGYLETAFFASALGVTARDLGIDVKDYSVLALLNVAFVALAALCLSAMYRCDPTEAPMADWIAEGGARATPRRWLARAGFFGFLLMTLAVGAAGFELAPGNMWMILLPAGPAYLAVVTAKQGRVKVAALMLSVAALSLVAIACYSANAYAVRLRAAARTAMPAPMPPPTLRSILQPEVGIATTGTTTTCAVRVSPGVLLGRTATTVVIIDRFAVRHCDVEDVPFG